MESSFEYLLNNKNAYTCEHFIDASELKEYLRKEENSVEERADFELIYSVVESITQLRFAAEENFSKTQHKVFGKRKELPLSWQEVENELTKKKDREPPRRIITTIAQQHMPMIRVLSENMRKILKREREKVHISSVQQIDSSCLRWLTRQPGYNPEEKAGNSQRLLAVVRKESVNTLENRVFKEFLRLCVVSSQKYLKKFRSINPQSDRIIAVQHLLAFCKHQLHLPIFNTISSLTSLPTPNYALQYHHMYAKIWNLYRLLMYQTNLVELVWRYRHNLFSEFYFLNILAYFHGEMFEKQKPVFSGDVMISFSTKDGLFFSETNFYNIFEYRDCLFEISVKQHSRNLKKLIVTQFKDGRKINSQTYIPVFIPNYIQETIKIPNDGVKYIVYTETTTARVYNIDSNVRNIIEEDFSLL